jgi:hypothetical protein
MIRFRHSFRAFQLAVLLACPTLALAEPITEPANDLTRGRQWGNATEGLALSIAAEKQRYAPGEHIVLNVLLKNSGESEVLLWDNYVLVDYRTTVLGPDDRRRPLRLDGRVVNEENLWGISSTSHKLRPREINCVELVMDRLYDFTQEGRYVISVERVRVIPAQETGRSPIRSAESPPRPPNTANQSSMATRSDRLWKSAEQYRSISVRSNELAIVIDSSLTKPDASAGEPDKPVVEYVAMRTPEEQAIAAFRSDPRGRLDTAKWLGEHKSVNAVPHLARRIDAVLGSKGDSTSLNSELAALSLALGQIGDQRGYSAVRKACDHLSSSLASHSDPEVLTSFFTAYRAMDLLGHKGLALVDLTQFHDKHGSKMPPRIKAEYEKRLSEAAKSGG